MYRIIIVLLWLVWLSSCKSTEKSAASQTVAHRVSSSQLAKINSQFSTFNTHFSFQANGYVFVKETQTVTEYDTSKPGNPIAKETKTEKDARAGVQATSGQSCHSERSEESESTSKEEDDSQLLTSDSQLEKSVPVIQSSLRLYVIGGIAIAAITLVTAVIRRRKKK